VDRKIIKGIKIRLYKRVDFLETKFFILKKKLKIVIIARNEHHEKVYSEIGKYCLFCCQS
jgi:hypothetical protein